MKREILVVALLFLSISSCKKAENPVNPSWELSGKIVYTTWDYESVKNSIYVLDLSIRNPVPKLLVDEAGEPRVSTDGQTIVFSKISPAGSFDIYRINVDGSDMVNLTDRQWVTEGSPDWSPDGQWIIFTGDIPGYERLYIMDRDGKSIHPITDTTYYAGFPSWGGPYNWTIAFLYRPPFSYEHSKMRLRTISPEGSNMVDLDSMMGGCLPLWSPDSRRIVYDVFMSGVWVIDIFTRIHYLLKTNTLDFSRVFSPQWMADGSLLAVGSKIADTSDTKYGIYKIGLGSQGVLSVQKIVDEFKNSDASGIESPDSHYIGIFGRRQPDQGIYFYIYDRRNSSLERVAEISPSATAYVDPSYAQWLR